jgi:hypothetical protein
MLSEREIMDHHSFSSSFWPHTITHVGQLHAVSLQGMRNNLYQFRVRHERALSDRKPELPVVCTIAWPVIVGSSYSSLSILMSYGLKDLDSRHKTRFFLPSRRTDRSCFQMGTGSKTAGAWMWSLLLWRLRMFRAMHPLSYTYWCRCV